MRAASDRTDQHLPFEGFNFFSTGNFITEAKFEIIFSGEYVCPWITLFRLGQGQVGQVYYSAEVRGHESHKAA